jgi:hypothetical protein
LETPSPNEIVREISSAKRGGKKQQKAAMNLPQFVARSQGNLPPLAALQHRQLPPFAAFAA